MLAAQARRYKRIHRSWRQGSCGGCGSWKSSRRR